MIPISILFEIGAYAAPNNVRLTSGETIPTALYSSQGSFPPGRTPSLNYAQS